MKSKNPQVKEGTLKFLGRCLATSISPIQPSQVKPLAEALAVLLEDGFEGARNEAATCLGTLMKMVGERPLNALMDGLADMRKAKVKESYEKAVVKCKSSGTGPPKVAPAPKSTVKKVPAVTKPPAVDEEEAPPKNPPNHPPARAPVGTNNFYFWKCIDQFPDRPKSLQQWATLRPRNHHILLLPKPPSLPHPRHLVLLTVSNTSTHPRMQRPWLLDCCHPPSRRISPMRTGKQDWLR
jgi:hypothetical protein